MDMLQLLNKLGTYISILLDFSSRKYKYIDTSLNRKKAAMKLKLPDIKKALEIVEFLKERSKTPNPTAITSKFMLCDNLWANASIKNDTGKVCLWLGAETMVEYPYDEALELLKKNLSNAEKYLESIVTKLFSFYYRRMI